LCLTPTFVLLAEFGATDRHLVGLRVSNTVLGALLAYLAAWLLWPASERGRVRDDLRNALHALADYTRCIGECDDAHAKETRRAFIVAMQNADASLQRVLSESDRSTEALMAVLVYIRRFALVLSPLVKGSIDRIRLGPTMRRAYEIVSELVNAIDQQRAPAAIDGEVAFPELVELHRAVARIAIAA